MMTDTEKLRLSNAIRADSRLQHVMQLVGEKNVALCPLCRKRGTTRNPDMLPGARYCRHCQKPFKPMSFVKVLPLRPKEDSQ